MMEQGLLKEVENLVNQGVKKGMTAMDGIGYKELLDYLEGNTTLEYAIDLIKKKSRNYAKRQLTWFRREEDVIWIDKSIYKSEKEQMDFIITNLKEKGIVKGV